MALLVPPPVELEAWARYNVCAPATECIVVCSLLTANRRSQVMRLITGRLSRRAVPRGRGLPSGEFLGKDEK
jgi:hypothetical protein